jgi:chemotaxis family two-component system sensor kinase Cph1
MNQAIPLVIDLSTCAREPIRTPGSIQPHGFLLTLSEGLDVLQASANLASWTGLAARMYSASRWPVIGADTLQRLAPELPSALGPRPLYLGTVTAGSGRCFDVLGHRWDQLIIVEFELVERAVAADFRHMYPLIGDFLLKVNEAGDIAALAHQACERVRAVSGFGRVLAYQFDSDGHGKVMAESKEDAIPLLYAPALPGLGHPGPGARAVCPVAHPPDPGRQLHAGAAGPGRESAQRQANDLSFAALRSVSPVHLQYMRNMNTLASMSMSLMVKGKLWGLISCHNEGAHARSIREAQRLRAAEPDPGAVIESREDAAELQFRLEVRRIMVSMLAGLTQGSDFFENLSSVFPELLRFARASGVAIVVDDRVLTYGDTPDDDEVRKLVDWLTMHDHGEVFSTDKLSAAIRGAGVIRNASGLLAMPISRIHKHYLLWFRPEYVHTIEWAGNPHAKAVILNIAAENPPGAPPQLSPRTSFAAWRETIHGASVPWHAGELELAVEFRTALLGIALERAEQMAALAEELGRANKELEAFSYSVSHDLRAPLRHIVGFADLLIESAGSEDTIQRQRFLKNIKDSARLAGKLVDDLLSFSQMGRASLHPLTVDMNELFKGCIDRLSLETRGRNIEWDRRRCRRSSPTRPSCSWP